MKTAVFFIACVAIIVYIVIDFISQYKKKQLKNELPVTITKPDVQSLFSGYKDKEKRRKKQYIEIKNTPKNYGQYLQSTGKQKWIK